MMHPGFRLFLKKRFETGNPKHFAVQEQRRILGKFVKHAGYVAPPTKKMYQIFFFIRLLEKNLPAP